MKMFSVGPPGSGALLALTLNILDEFHFTPNDLNGTLSTIKTYHKIIETFKYVFALRTEMGDDDYVDISGVSVYILSIIKSLCLCKINHTKEVSIDRS